MEEQKHYVLVDNEAYELYDGNGSFYVTKASHPAEPFSIKNSMYSMNERYSTNPAVPLPNISSCQVGQNLEPIIINDYSTMNYFTQAASDVTIYLNSNNENNFMQNIADQKEHVVDPEEIVDLTKFSNKRSSTEITETEATLDLNMSIKNISNEELDAPEFIDISKLKLSYDDTSVKRSVQNCCVNLTSDNSEDDEVVFVKEFKANHSENSKNPLDLRRHTTKVASEKQLPEPRRNPKRKVQLLKESYELAVKLSDKEVYYGSNRRCYRENTENSRRTNKNTGASLNPKIILTAVDYKEWPADGLHERPVFNMATKKIEKFDFKPADDKRKAPSKKADTKSTKSAAKKPGKKGTRKAVTKARKAKKASPERGINKEFAALTHETLHEVIKYVAQVKQYNEIRMGKVCDTKTHVESDSLIDEAESLITVVRSDTMEENLNNAVDLLTDNCILYSLANGVCQKSVAEYLQSIKDVKTTGSV